MGAPTRPDVEGIAEVAAAAASSWSHDDTQDAWINDVSGERVLLRLDRLRYDAISNAELVPEDVASLAEYTLAIEAWLVWLLSAAYAAAAWGAEP